MPSAKQAEQNQYQDFDVIVIGGGAAGLMCAITAGQRGRKVLVLECSNKIGKKILMSGGGRCNFTNLDIQMDCFLSTNPHFFKSALNQYTQWDFISLVSKHGIEYHEKELGQLFCDSSAKQIVAMLETECQKVGIQINLQENLTELSIETDPIENHSSYVIKTDKARYRCNSVVVATGGLSIPTLGGATGLGYQLAEQFGLAVVERKASLVPMTVTGKLQDIVSSLSGVSLPVVASVPSKAFALDLLFTHRGISGPAILQLSNYWNEGEVIFIDFLPAQSLEELKGRLISAKNSSPNLLLKTYLSNFLPKAVSHAILQFKDFIPSNMELDLPMQSLKNDVLYELATTLKGWRLNPAGTEGYRTAEVTKGGVDVNSISSKTMEVKHQPGLFFVGEVLDVTAHLGGYNFQWAWSSGYVAGLHA